MTRLTSTVFLMLVATTCVATACASGAGDAPSVAVVAQHVRLVEASGIAVRGGGKVAVIGGDETADRLWAVSLDDLSVRWELVFPRGTPLMDDVEALAPHGKNALFVICSQSRTKPREKAKYPRDRLALVTLSPDTRQVVGVRVYEGLRTHLLTYLGGSAGDLFENPAAVSLNGPNRGGLNVEGLAVWNEQLLLGLRSPATRGGAVVIPIAEPGRLVEEGGQARPPRFGRPMILPTKPGEGIRDMVTAKDGILVLLGAENDAVETPFRIVHWDPATNKLRDVEVPGFKAIRRPEGIALDAEGRLLVVQDFKLPLPAKILFRLDIKKP
ncbi:MAG TPA: DUF3616 domain-containing protein [Phycisphaerae bacterium]|nr:DUF3616 domain-containing protein [Phycisphaerae bacterium]